MTRGGRFGFFRKMKTSIHLSRSNGYRELGMYDESILEPEEFEGEDRWHPSVVKARCKTCKNGELVED